MQRRPSPERPGRVGLVVLVVVVVLVVEELVTMMAVVKMLCVIEGLMDGYRDMDR